MRWGLRKRDPQRLDIPEARGPNAGQPPALWGKRGAKPCGMIGLAGRPQRLRQAWFDNELWFLGRLVDFLLIRGSRVRVPDGSPIISVSCLDLLRRDSVRAGLARFRCAETRRKKVVERRCGLAEVLCREVSVAKRDREGLVSQVVLDPPGAVYRPAPSRRAGVAEIMPLEVCDSRATKRGLPGGSRPPGASRCSRRKPIVIEV